MRILLTADPELPVPPRGYGGIERIVAALAEEYAAAGHQVGLLAHAGSTAPAERHFFWPRASSQGRGNVLRNALGLRRAARAFRADAVHSFSRLACLAPLLINQRIPALMSYQRHTGGRSITLMSRLGGRRLAFTGCSEFICRQGRPWGGAWSAVPNFVDVRRTPFTPAVAADAPLLFLSRIEEIKGAHLAIAIARAAGRRLVLAGNRVDGGGGARYWTERIAPHLGREGVEWVGEVDDEAKRVLFAQAAALLVPIQWDEPFGIVFAEALAAGVPVLTCPHGAATEIVEEGRTGFLFADVASGVAAVRALHGIARSACRAAASERFDAPGAAAQYLARLGRLREASIL